MRASLPDAQRRNMAYGTPVARMGSEFSSTPAPATTTRSCRRTHEKVRQTSTSLPSAQMKPCPQPSRCGPRGPWTKFERDGGDAVLSAHSLRPHAHGVDDGFGMVRADTCEDGFEGPVIAEVAGAQQTEESDLGPAGVGLLPRVKGGAQSS